MMNSKFLKILFLTLAFSSISNATFSLSENMDKADRRETLKILGPGSAHRNLTAQFPLGGYSGFELGLSRNYIPVANLTALGTSSNDEDNISYPLVTFGKGLFYDLDFFISFVPFAQSDKVQNVSTLGRWTFYQSESWPIHFLASVNGSSSTFLNKLSTMNYGYDLFMNVKSQNLSLFFGLGTLFSTGNFVGGAGGITSSGKSESENITSLHTTVGADLQLKSWFVSGEVDRYSDTFYSLKVGYRY